MDGDEIIVGTTAIEQVGPGLWIRCLRAGLGDFDQLLSLREANELRDALNIWHGLQESDE